jgi:hypothetical protein
MLWTILFFFGTSWMTVQGQTWPGVYRMGSSCSTTSCCCLVNNLIVTRPSSNTLAVNTSLAGQCSGQSYFAGTATYPTGYSLSLSFSIITLNVMLSNDSNTLTVINPIMSSCNGIGVRTVSVSSTAATAAVTMTTSPGSAAAQWYMNGMILWSTVLISCFLNI